MVLLILINNSTGQNYPKTLFIRNQEGGLVWQVYHVESLKEAEKLSSNAHRNGFLETTLEDYDPSVAQTWEDWRETEGGKNIINS